MSFFRGRSRRYQLCPLNLGTSEGFALNKEAEFMETMKKVCGICGDEFTPKRKTKIYCSDTCRKKAFDNEKKAEATSAPVDAISPIEQPWEPTRRESILNKLTRDSDVYLWKIEDLAEKLERCPIVEQILALTKQATRNTFHDEVRQEVDGFDMIQKMYQWDAFEARTGLVVPHKKLPL